MHPFSTPKRNHKVFLCFQEVEKGSIGNNGLITSYLFNTLLEILFGQIINTYMMEISTM